MPVEKRWYTADEVATYCGLSRGHVYNLVQAGGIPYTRLGPERPGGRRDGRRLRFDIREIDEWMSENSVEVA